MAADSSTVGGCASPPVCHGPEGPLRPGGSNTACHCGAPYAFHNAPKGVASVVRLVRSRVGSGAPSTLHTPGGALQSGRLRRCRGSGAPIRSGLLRREDLCKLARSLPAALPFSRFTPTPRGRCFAVEADKASPCVAIHLPQSQRTTSGWLQCSLRRRRTVQLSTAPKGVLRLVGLRTPGRPSCRCRPAYPKVDRSSDSNTVAGLMRRVTGG